MKTNDLTHGNIKKELIALALPLILGNILQQFYNTIDSFIVGRYVGHNAFAAVGIAGSVMNLFIFVLSGGCNGFSVIFAELYGQKKWELLRKESFISLMLGGCFTILLSAGSLLCLNQLLRAIHTPEEVYIYVVHYAGYRKSLLQKKISRIVPDAIILYAGNTEIRTNVITKMWLYKKFILH